jgi:hypothetical protein
MRYVTGWMLALAIAVPVSLLAACVGNRVSGWPSRALVADVPNSTLIVWEAVLRAYYADPGPFHPYIVRPMPVILWPKGPGSVPAVWAARLVADSVVDGVCDASAMLNCWSDVHARYLELGMPARAGGDTVVVRIDFAQQTTGLCGTDEWSRHQFLWSTEARVVVTGKKAAVVRDSIVSVSDEVSCSVEPMSAEELRSLEREQTLRALAGCYVVVLMADSAQLMDMKRSPPSWIDTRPHRIVMDTIQLDSVPATVEATRDAWRLSSRFAKYPGSWWAQLDSRIHMEMGDFFVLRSIDLWPTMTPGHFEGRAHELTDSSQEYFYSAQADRIEGECRAT